MAQSSLKQVINFGAGPAKIPKQVGFILTVIDNAYFVLLVILKLRTIILVVNLT